ncbi:hypothetical protein MRB53_004471 [Persea americana]|uniref:Uncharacterized protein n=1 Tax=Persea americana TaxID=3435 RepID=A0ACC2MBA8_PERAE|nr:hypothetical protein MRB53_004471 [Persea americana]
MVSKVVESSTGRHESVKKQQQDEAVKGNGQRQEGVLQCNKGKGSKFKKSSFSGEEDATSSAMLLLACIACALPST